MQFTQNANGRYQNQFKQLDHTATQFPQLGDGSHKNSIFSHAKPKKYIIHITKLKKEKVQKISYSGS